MKITEMQNRLEELQNELLIISETATVIETSLDDKNSQISWAFFGVIRSIDKSVKDIGSLVEEVIKMRNVIENLV